MTDTTQKQIAELEKKVGAGGASPLFAQLASIYLDAGRARDALRLCDEGLGNFPFYTTGHLIKGKALAALSMTAEARREFEWVAEFLPSNDAIVRLLSELPPAEEAVLTSPTDTDEAQAPLLEAPPLQEQPAPPPAGEIAPQPEMTPAESLASAGFGVPPPFAEEPAATVDEQPATTFAGLSPESPAEAPVNEDPFGLASTEPQIETAAVPPSTSEEATPFADFPFAAPEPATSETGTPALETEPPSQSDTPPAEADIFSFGPATTQEESFQQYATRKRSELPSEPAMTIEEFLSSGRPEPAPPAEAPTPTIEDLAEKLQSPPKITPVINIADRSTAPASESELPSGTGFVTPTLAEIYAKQGWYDDAIKAYKSLSITKPAERERFEKRIAELEEMKKQSK